MDSKDCCPSLLSAESLWKNTQQVLCDYDSIIQNHGSTGLSIEPGDKVLELQSCSSYKSSFTFNGSEGEFGGKHQGLSTTKSSQMLLGKTYLVSRRRMVDE